MEALKLLTRSTSLKSRIAHPTPQKIPSASGQGFAPAESPSTTTRKRKRSSEDGIESKASTTPLSEEEVRTVHKKHGIKIVDLNRFRAATKQGESRKSHKEQSRLFPQPLTSFEELGHRYHANAALTRNVAGQAYLEPTEVQIATIPLLLADTEGGGDEEPNLLTVAPTGSGKTLAFLIPLIEKISRSHRKSGDESRRHVRAIILAPTKELVSQIVNEGRKLGASTGVSITAVRKGMELFEGSPTAHEDEDEDEGGESEDDVEMGQSAINRNVVKSDILVSTPLSLVHLLCPSWEEDEQVPPRPLPNVDNLVFDEADVLLDPLFRSQTLAIWSACTSPAMRISMWSATIGSNIEELAVQAVAERLERLGVPGAQRPPLIRTIIGLKDTSIPTISHRLIYTATESGKLLGMRQLLHPSSSSSTQTSKQKEGKAAPLRPPFLVFTQTIARAQSLHSELQYDIPAPAGGSSRVAVLHSSLSSTARSSIMQSFRSGKIWVLITTDLLSRGVDFRGVNVVVNYDIPTTVAGYIHRAGRTGRAGREGGVCVSFYTKEDVRYVKGIANVIAASEKAQLKSRSDGDLPGGAGGIAPWLLHALPDVSKPARKDLKLHGVQSRRAMHADDDEKTKRAKRKARIGTQSGYERRQSDRKRGAIEASRRTERMGAQEKERGRESEGGGGGDREWEGFG